MSYRAIVTHDIDFVTKFKSLRNVASAWYRRENTLWQGWKQLQRSKQDRALDPYWSMLDMLKVNNSKGLETHFYFKVAVTNPKYDWNDYRISDPDIVELIRELRVQGAKIGLHPSYETYLDGDQIRREKDLLEKAVDVDVIHSRQHFLRYELPTTFKLLSDAGIKYDSSIRYNSKDCASEFGKTYEMTYKGDDLGISQMPFTLMETHRLADPLSLLADLEKAAKEIKANKGQVVLLWHNNNFETSHQVDLYNKCCDLIKSSEDEL